MIPQNRKYIFILVHYGSIEATDGVLKQLFSGKDRPDKVVVIDHAKEIYHAPLSAPEVQVYRPRHNDGYGAGLNIGLGTLLNDGTDKDDIVICMNNDVEIKKDLVQSIRSWWQENPEPALMGIKKGQVHLLTGRSALSSSSSLISLPYLHGSFIAAPYQVFASLRGWPDQYFLYWEDAFLSRAAAAKKIPLKVNTKIDLHHDDDIRDTYTDDQTYYLVRNGALFLERETPYFWRKWWWIVNRLRYVWHRYGNPHSHEVVVQALLHAIKGVKGKRDDA